MSLASFVAALSCSTPKPDRSALPGGETDSDKPNGGCLAAASDQMEFFVERGASGGTGSRTCPFGTIGAGLAAAARSTAPKTIVHVGPGTFDAEAFPLHVGPNVSLEGAGSDSAGTIVVGSGLYALAGPLASAAMVTLVVGSATGRSTISRLALQGSDLSNFGIVCDAGNAASTPDATPEPNVVLREVDLSHYANSAREVTASAVLVTTSGDRPGCNLQIAASRIRAAERGILATGCRTPERGGPVALEVGDGSQSGATLFRNVGSPDNNGEGVFVESCVSRTIIRHATFTNSTGGMRLVQWAALGPLGHVEIASSHFLDLSNVGVGIGPDTVLNELSDNEFRNITTRALAAGYRGLGLALGDDAKGTTFPRVMHARGNVFVGNDVGVLIRGNSTMASDFGKVGDLGRNTFRCNSATNSINGTGGDFVVEANPIGQATLLLVGNTWDAIPVRPLAAKDARDGDDLVASVPVDTRGAVTTADPCAPGDPGAPSH